MGILTANYSTIDHEEMAKVIGLKVKHIPILIASFLQESGPILDALEKAIAERDFSGIKAQAHAIKGSAGNLRFNEIYEMSKEIESAGSDANSDFEYEAYLEAVKKAVATIPA